MTALGIDLGTAFARAAVFRARAPELLQFPDGAHSVPAVVALAGNEFKLGRAAVGRAATHPTHTVRGIKRFLGRSVGDAVIDKLAERAAFSVEEGEHKRVLLRLGDQQREPEELAAALLAHLADVAEQRCGERPVSAVLTTPYWYGQRQRQALIDAARRAGLSALQVVSEATATALSLLEAGPGDRTVAIVDVGAGGCTASILELGPRRVRLIASNGDPLGGGEDVDRGLVKAVLKGLRSRLGEFDDNPSVAEMVRQVVEGAKRDLGQAAAVTAVVPFLPVGTGMYNQQVVIERQSVEQLMRDTTERVGAACQKVLGEAALRKDQLAAVYATGGMTRLPVVRGAIASALGEIASRMLDPDGSVALGAAYQAGMLSGLAESIPVLDVQRAKTVMPRVAERRHSIPAAQVHTAPPPAARGRSSAPPAVGTGSSAPPRVEVRASQPAASQRVDVESYRMELAGLLASLRAGAVTDGGEGQRRRLVARGTTVIEDDGELTEAGLSENVQRLTEIWAQLGRVMQTVRQYRWQHPQTHRHLERAVELIAAAHQVAPYGVRWDIGSMHLSFGGEVIWKPDKPPFDRIPYELFADGVRKVQFSAGLGSTELKDFLGVLMRDAAVGFGADDDAATALWDRRFDYIAYVAVDAFAEGDDPAFHARRDDIAAQLAQLAALSEDGDEVLGAMSAAHDERAALAARLALDDGTRARLIEELALDANQWRTRYAQGFVSTYVDAERQGDVAALMEPIAEWTDEQVSAHAPSVAFEMLGALTQAFDNRTDPKKAHEFRSRAVGTMFPAERLQIVCDDIKEISEPPPAMIEGIERALELLPGDEFFQPALGFYTEVASPRLQQWLAAYLGRCAAGHEAEIGALLATTEPLHALRFLRRLREVGSGPAQAAIHAALKSPHVEVRMEALACLPDAPAEQLRGDVQRILDDPEPGVRRQALKTIADRKIVAAGPALVRHIQSPEFHEVEPKERRLLLEAVAALNPRRAEELAIALLEKSQLIRSDEVDQSRALAAEFLGGSESQEALDALQKAAKKRWFTTASVRDTAEKAATSVFERRSLRPGAGGGDKR